MYTLRIEYGVFWLVVEKRKRAMVLRVKPDSMNDMWLNLSDSLPLRGPTIKKAISNGNILIPASKGLIFKTS